MPTIEAEPTPQPATWEEWMADWPPMDLPSYDKQLITRDELIALRAGAPAAPDGLRAGITASELRYLESIGVLPRPVRKRHKGATRAVYPAWVNYLLIWLRILQRRGVSTQEIGPWLREHAASIVDVTSRDADADEMWPILASAPTTPSLPPNLRRELERLGRHHARTSGVPTTTIEVVITDAEGGETRYRLPLEVSTD